MKISQNLQTLRVKLLYDSFQGSINSNSLDRVDLNREDEKKAGQICFVLQQFQEYHGVSFSSNGKDKNIGSWPQLLLVLYRKRLNVQSIKKQYILFNLKLMIQKNRAVLAIILFVSCAIALKVPTDIHNADSIPAVPYNSAYSPSSPSNTQPTQPVQPSQPAPTGQTTPTAPSTSGIQPHSIPAQPHNPSSSAQPVQPSQPDTSGVQPHSIPAQPHNPSSSTQPVQPSQPAPSGQTTPTAPQTPSGTGSFPAKPFPVKCENGTVLNDKTLECECPKDKPSKDAQGNCAPCTDNKTWDETKKECTCQGKYQADSTGKCQECEKPNTWDLKNNKCFACPEGFTFDQNTSQCVCPHDKPYLKTEAGKNTCVACETKWIAENSTCLKCEDNKTWDAKTSSCICQGDFKTGADGKCIECPSPNSWDEKNKKCVRCPDGFTFDQNASQCVCPKDKPYLNNDKACVACDTKWDETTNTCTVCKLGTVWEASNKTCIKGCPYPLVNNECKCPSTSPVLDEATQQCKPCDKEKPIWNGKECKPCPTGTNYVVAIGHCVTCVEGTKFDEKEQKCIHA